MSAEKRSVSAPDDLFEQADTRAHQLGYSNFSQYIQALIRADVITSAAHVRETAQAAPAGPGSTVVTSYRKTSKKDTRRKILDIVKKKAHQAQPPTPPTK